jgi:hypothetical protein
MIASGNAMHIPPGTLRTGHASPRESSALAEYGLEHALRTKPAALEPRTATATAALIRYGGALRLVAIS